MVNNMKGFFAISFILHTLAYSSLGFASELGDVLTEKGYVGRAMAISTEIYKDGKLLGTGMGETVYGKTFELKDEEQSVKPTAEGVATVVYGFDCKFVPTSIVGSAARLKISCEFADENDSSTNAAPMTDVKDESEVVRVLRGKEFSAEFDMADGTVYEVRGLVDFEGRANLSKEAKGLVE